MGVDYEQLLKDNEAAKQGEIKQVNDAYGKTASDYQTEVDNQQQQLKDYEAEQTRLQQEQTDFAIDKINQQQEQAEKDYTKEQQAAYGDYKRQTDPYGVNAEQMAALGLSRSGYSESSNVAMYTAYQNRVAAARASIEQAKLTFENAIREAKLTNDINLAKIAQETLEKSLALNMESIIYLGNLELEKAAKLSGIEQTYYDRAQDIRDAQAAEITRAQQESMFSITGNEGIDDGTLEEMLKSAYPNGVVDDVEFWNQMAEAAGGEEVLKALGYQLAGQVGAPLTATGMAPAGDQVDMAVQGKASKYTDEYTLMVEDYEALKNHLADLKEMYGSNPRTERENAELQKAKIQELEEKVANYPLKPNAEYSAIKFAVEQAKKAYYKANAELQKKKNPSPSAKRSVERRKEEWEALEEKLKQTPEYLIVRKTTTAGNAGTSAHSKRNWYEAGLR